MDQRGKVWDIAHRTVQAATALGMLSSLFVFGGGNAVAGDLRDAAAAEIATAQPENSRMWMIVGERHFAISLADTEAARAFAVLLPLTLDMADLHSNEKHAELSTALPTNASRPGTIQNGDLMLFSSRTLVVFYQTFSSPYSYTHIGRVDEPAGLAQALGRGSVRIGFSQKLEGDPM